MKVWLLKARPRTPVEWLAIAAVFAILVAILISETKWASSGSVIIPVDVEVFDAYSATPIEGAFVAIVWAPPATSEFELHEYRDKLSNGFSAINETGVQTNVAGRATIDQQFRTGANHKMPIAHVHTRWYWVLVSAADYGSVSVPLRYESMTSKDLKAMGRLPAYVGLTRLRTE
ncbi:MAG: hypothetical protein Fues2KO_54600 [Fuerstiella sp.]